MDDMAALQLLGGNSSIFGSPFMPQMSGLNLGGVFPGLNGASGALMSLMLQPYIQQLGQNSGMLGFQFGGTQNLADNMRGQQMMMERQAMMAQASQADRLRMTQMLQNTMTMFGGGTPDQLAAADRTSQFLTGPAGQMAAMIAPDAVDRMFGLRGSQMVMANRIFDATRYAFDPVSGRMGMSAGDTASMATRLHTQLFGAEDDNLTFRRMNGLSAGQTGSLYGELQRRGVMTGDDTQKGGSAAEIRESSVSGKADQLRKFSGAVAAMREIFGDAGNPNAPIPAILNGLEALTQGGLSTMDPGKLENTVRRIHQLSRMAGMGLGATLQVTAQGAGLADRMGLDRQFAVSATADAVSFATAFGGSNLAKAGFGGLGKDAVLSMSQQLTMAAASSPLANNLNAILAMDSAMQGREGYGGSQLAAAAAAINAGQQNFTFNGQTQSVAMGRQAILEMAQGAGLSGANASAIMGSPTANQRFGVGVTDVLSRRFQGQIDIVPIYASALGQSFASNGIGNPQLAAALANAWLSADINPSMSRNDVANKLLGAVDPALIAGMDRTKLLETTVAGLGVAADQLPRRGFTEASAMQLFNSRLFERQKLIEDVAKGQGNFASALAGLGQGGIERNFMEFLITNKGATVNDFLKQVVGGGVTMEQAQAAVGSKLGGIEKEVEELRDPNVTPERRAVLTDSIRKKTVDAMGSLQKASPQANEMITRYRAGNEAVMMGTLGQALGGNMSLLGPLEKALAMATPEQRAKLLTDAEAFMSGPQSGPPEAAAQRFAELKRTGDARGLIRQYIGEQGLSAAGMAPSEVKLAPDTVLKIEGEFKVDKNGMLTLLNGKGTPGSARSVGGAGVG